MNSPVSHVSHFLVLVLVLVLLVHVPLSSSAHVVTLNKSMTHFFNPNRLLHHHHNSPHQLHPQARQWFTTFYCGTWYKDAYKCGVRCPSGLSSECPAGESCFAGITQCANKHLAPPVSSSDDGTVVAYYKWTWPNVTPGGLPDATFSVAFSGWMDVDNILSESNRVYDTLRGEKYVSFGGGNENGHITTTRLAAIDSAMRAGRFDQYVGVVYDIETGDTGLTGQILQSLRLAKSRGLKTVVTVSHSAPYGFPDAHSVMNAVLQSRNVDYISPQLYTQGTEPANDYDISQGYRWENYVKRAKNVKVIVSIVDRTYYADAQRFFGNLGIALSGFIQWKQV